MIYHFNIDGKPQPKQRPRASNGHFYTPQKTSDYEALVGWSYLKESGKKLDGPIWIYIIIKVKIPKSRKELKPGMYHIQKPDLDNIMKSIFDGLNGIAFVDDSQICSSIVEKIWDNEDGVEVFIKELEGDYNGREKNVFDEDM